MKVCCGQLMRSWAFRHIDLVTNKDVVWETRYICEKCGSYIAEPVKKRKSE